MNYIKNIIYKNKNKKSNYIEKKYDKLFKYINDNGLNFIIKNEEILSINKLKAFSEKDIYIGLYVSAIDSKDINALNNLIDIFHKEKDIIYGIYERKLLTSERLQFIVENEIDNFRISSKLIRTLLRDNNVDLLDIIFGKFKFFDNESIIEFCILHKNGIAISDLVLNEKILNKRYKASLHFNGCSNIVSKYLINACNEGQEHLVIYLVENGADVNSKCGSYTPLIAACNKNNEAIVKYLVSHKADVNQGNKDSPLISACKNRNEIMVKYLIENGADVDGDVKGFFECDYNTPLLTTCSNGDIRLVKYLIEHGATIDKGYGVTPLTTACEYGNDIIVEYLIEQGADINKGIIRTPLIITCEMGNEPLVKYLIEHGANINRNLFGYSPLIAACLNNKETIMKYLIEHGADISKGGEYYNPLIAACEAENESMVKYLIDHGADVNSGISNTPLISACSKGKENIVKYLVEHKALVNRSVIKDNQRYSPLKAAYNNGNKKIIEYLEERGANF